MSHASSPQPPFALAVPVLSHRSIAALAARAPMGPSREVALAWFLCARLLDGALGPLRLSATTRTARSTAARNWLASTGLPAASRMPLAKVIDACGADTEPDGRRIARTVTDALAATGEHLDAATRTELESLAGL